MHGGVLTHYISENKKKLYCDTMPHKRGLSLYYMESLQEDDTKEVDMRYPLKYDTTKKESLDFNYL